MGTALFIAFSFWLFALTFAVGLYFLPTIVAVVAHRRNAPLVALVNTLIGWSFVGWVVALVMAATREPQPVQVVMVNRTPPSPAPVTYDDAKFWKVPGSSIEPR